MNWTAAAALARQGWKVRRSSWPANLTVHAIPFPNRPELVAFVFDDGTSFQQCSDDTIDTSDWVEHTPPPQHRSMTDQQFEAFILMLTRTVMPNRDLATLQTLHAWADTEAQSRGHRDWLAARNAMFDRNVA